MNNFARRAAICSVWMTISCVPTAAIDAAKDRDQDGYVAWQLDGDDCDDSEPTANPGEQELCGDGVDNDCDGNTDDDGVNATTWYPDLDGDGFAIDAPVSACTQPSSHRSSLDAGIDCDDTNGSVHPGATDSWYDGVDQNCDAVDDYDQDGDTYRDPSGGGSDCDDMSASIHPGAIETCGNHVDDDCDGTHNSCAWTGDVSIEDGPHTTIVWAEANPATLQVSVGDTQNDGHDDLVVHSLGSDRAYLFEGPFSGTLSTALHSDVEFEMPELVNLFGVRPDIGGDLSGDGKADLLVYNAEEAEWPVLHAHVPPFRSSMTLGDVTKTFYGPDPAVTPNSGFGFVAGYLGDLDGDGFHAFHVVQGGTTPPVCYVLEGLGGGTSLPNIADATLLNCSVGLKPSIDFDGDGNGDIAFASTDAIGFVSGLVQGTVDLATAPRRVLWAGSGTVSPAGTGLLDADDEPDLIAFYQTGPGYEAGLAVDVVFGPIGPTATTAHPRLAVTPADADDAYVPLPPIDFDGDGQQDLVLLHFSRDLVAESFVLTVDVFTGPLSPGTKTVGDATTRITIDDAILALFMDYDTGDFDGDGFGDVVVGGYGFAWVVRGQGR